MDINIKQISATLRACPCCGKDALDNEIRTKLKQLCEINGINGELVNPGGRQLRFSTTGKRVV